MRDVETRCEDPHLVVPSACTVRVRALVAGVDVDEYATVAIVVDGALAVASAAEAGERNALAGETLVEAWVRATRETAGLDDEGKSSESEHLGEEHVENAGRKWTGGAVRRVR